MNLNNVSPKMVKKSEFSYFHVFTDAVDCVFDATNSYNEARKKAFVCKDELIKEGYQSIRVYFVMEMQDPRDGEMIQIEESCLYSLGSYPY